MNQVLLYWSGELPEEQRRALEALLDRDAEARAFLHDVEGLARACRSGDPLAPRKDAVRGALAQWQAEHRNKIIAFPKVIWRVAAAAAVLALASWLYWTRQPGAERSTVVTTGTEAAQAANGAAETGDAAFQLAMAHDRVAGLLANRESEAGKRIKDLRQRISLLQAQPRRRFPAE